MLDEIRTFVTLAEAGSLQRAAERLLLTPSAVTRQIQRLETALGAPVLDRRVKPPRITPIGQSVLEQGRSLLRSFEAMKASASTKTEPAGVFRLGLSHGLAVAAIAAPIRQMTNRFSSLQPQLNADMTQNLLERVRRGDLDAAVMLLPAGEPLSPDLIGKVIATDHMTIVGPAGLLRGQEGDLRCLDGQAWVLNPPGCLVRETFRSTLEAAGMPLKVAAEVHNMDLQLSLVSAGYGLGLFPGRFLAQRRELDSLATAGNFGLDIPVSIAFVKAGSLGRLEPAAIALHEELCGYFSRSGVTATRTQA